MLDLSKVRTYPIAGRKNRENVEDCYFRPSKNVVRRPVSLGGKGLNFRVYHRHSIPTLHRRLLELAGGRRVP
jgi:hypothetical protein